MTIFQEHDPVRLKDGLPQHGLVAGEGGAVVHVHDGREAYEVEFVAEGGGTKALLTFEGDQLAVWAAPEAVVEAAE